MTERIQSLNAVSVLVKNYDEAITFFTEVLNFELIANEEYKKGLRWVLLHPPGLSSTGIMLHLAKTTMDKVAVGNQAGDQVLFVLQTNDFWRDYEFMLSKGVKFTETPRDEAYGTVAIFKDLYGNKWDLLQVKDAE
ncbi:VOC family protein [Alteromonas lipolytica]|uniref:Glyoxalase n=1 Tax=Alteromonas lipolytica TaxID=1856405 RepID=A0A1E8FJQ9_9ALTE|nr:VOC family protein [Alteromonas lipolytica]OFI36179.1 glyoxalase [Alteromonas lipolytica]GGF78454.1 hypothetical protein GCM10011338_33560 [Alteromonas lipolytica]